MRSLRERMRDVQQVGSVTWIGLRSERGAAMTVVDTAELVATRGILGDRASKSSAGGKRQVTLFQAEHLPVLSAWVGRDVEPHELRRNLVVAAINLVALVNLRFEVGDAILVGTGPCAPCSKMDVALGPGGFQAMRGHGGITASIERGGRIAIGAVVRVLP
ncbi:MAG: MOSC domain-containing protein [Kofleriaceae bacterium]